MTEGKEPKPQATFNTHGKRVEALAFSPDGKTLAAALKRTTPWGKLLLSLITKSTSDLPPSYTVKLWDVAKGKELASLPSDSGAMTFSPDGKLLALGWYGKVELWELKHNKPRHKATLRYPANRYGVTSLAFSPDSKSLSDKGR
jgi:WD40 repeat protein